jgi:hypothetical protein
MMPAGKYYVGDLCYVMHPEWDEFCDITIKGNECLDGEFNLADGRRFATFGTLYGDGLYASNIGTKHSVDAGLIGCILVSDIRDPEAGPRALNSLGAVIEFDKPFSVSSDDRGNITFGHVVIATGDDYEDEYDGQPDEAQEWHDFDPDC